MAKKMIRLKIGQLLQSRGMSTAEFVKKTNLAYNTVLGLRRGVVTRIDLDVMTRVCEALNVKPGDLFEIVDMEFDSPMPGEKEII